MHDDTTAGGLKQKTKTDGGGVRARGRVSGACKARPGPEVGNGGISRRSDRAKAVRNGGGWGTQTVPEKRDFGKRSVEVHLVSKKPRPLSHRQAYERQISSWVGDDQRTPAVVCFFLGLVFSIFQAEGVGYKGICLACQAHTTIAIRIFGIPSALP